MLELTWLTPSQYLVTGAPGRDAYILCVTPDLHYASGVAGSGRIWFLARAPNRIEIYDAVTSQLLNTIQLRTELKGNAIVASRDGRRLYLDDRIGNSSARTGAFIVADMETAQVIATYNNLPTGNGVGPVEREDGLLVLKACKFAEGGPAIVGSGAILLDPLTGAVQQELFDDLSYTGGLWHPSPEGRHWLRYDKTLFPIRTVTIDGAPRRIAAVRMQLWKSFPFCFVRTITLGWVTFDRLPGLGNRAHPETSDLGRCYEAISETLERLNLSPTQGLRESDLPQPWSSRPTNHLTSICMGVFRPYHDRVTWEPSGQAFWVDLYPGIFIRAEISGDVSSQMRLAPARRKQEDMRNIPKSVEGLPGGRARLIFEHGTAVITPPSIVHVQPYDICTIPETHDGWIPVDTSVKASVKAHQDRARRSERELHVPLASWTEADCIVAIERLTASIAPSIVKRADQGNLYAVFSLEGQNIGEDVFFERVAREYPRSIDAIARLVETVCTQLSGTTRHYVFWQASEGISLFAHAVKALATKGRSHLGLVRLYAIGTNVEFDLSYWRMITPTLLSALGEDSDDAVNFLIFTMLRNFYNSADPATVWRERLGKLAKAQFDPESFARHSLDQARLYENRADLNDGRDDEVIHGTLAFDHLAARLQHRNADPWESRMIVEWRRLHAILGPHDSSPRSHQPG